MMNLFVAPNAVFLELEIGTKRTMKELTPAQALEASEALRDLAHQAAALQAKCGHVPVPAPVAVVAR